MKIENPRESMLQSLHNACGFDTYRKTLDLSRNISTDTEYQKNFTNYYRVRRDGNWLKAYYTFFEKNKENKDITFETILRYISNVEHTVKKSRKNPTGKAKTVEASFASKMLATINPQHPVWDSQVLRFLQIETNDNLAFEEKLQASIEIYEKMENAIQAVIATDEGEACKKIFDEMFPSCIDFSDYKKIDFYMWNLGKGI